MKFPRWRKAAAIGSIVMCGVVLAAWAGLAYWYSIPADVEDFDYFPVCRCGPSRVWFHEGQIVLIKGHHPKSQYAGQIIGTYARERNTLRFFSRGGHESVYEIDGVGLRPPPGADVFFRDVYFAFDSRSPRAHLYFHSVTVRRTLEDWRQKTWDFIRDPFD